MPLGPSGGQDTEAGAVPPPSQVLATLGWLVSYGVGVQKGLTSVRNVGLPMGSCPYLRSLQGGCVSSEFQCPGVRLPSTYLEVASDELGHGVVVDVKGKRDTGLSLEPRSPDNGYSGHTGQPEACRQ